MSRQKASSNTTDKSSEVGTPMWQRILPLFFCTFLISNFFINNNVYAQSLLHHSTRAITQDQNGFIWLATSNGLVRYDSERSISFNSHNFDWPIPFNWINDIYLIDGTKLLLATETHKLWLFDTSNGSAVQLDISIDETSIYNIIEHNDNYYLYAPNKLYRINSKTLKATLLSNNIDIKSLKHTNYDVYARTSEAVFKITSTGLQQIASGNISSIETTTSKLIIAKNNNITVINNSGLQHQVSTKHSILGLTKSFDQKSIFTLTKQGNIYRYTLDNLSTLKHPYPKIDQPIKSQLFHDSTGVLWLIANQKLKKIIPSMTTNHVKIFDTNINALKITSHQSSLIIGSYGLGLSELFENKKILPNNINNNFSTKGKVITDLYSADENLYISTFDGLWCYNSKSKILSRVNFAGNNKLILDMTFKNKSLYLATESNGVYKFNLDTHSISEHLDENKLNASEIMNTLPITDELLWVATSSGISIIDANNPTKKINSLGGNKVVSLLEYNEKVFVATKGDGLIIYNLQGELLAHLAKNLSFTYMSYIEGEIWVSGNPGLYRINPDTHHLKMVPNTELYTFTKKPILLNNVVYAAHYGGVLEVPLATADSFNTKVYISKTTASGEAQLLSKAIKIDSSNDVISLELASLDFRPGQGKQFKYQINGGDWNEVNGNRLTLTGLSSGDYHIEIMGTNSLGQWSNFKAYADISVAYPWYWHPNSRVIYAVLITVTVLLIFWLLYLRSRSISHIHQLLNEEIKTHGQSTSIIRRKLEKVQALINSADKVHCIDEADSKPSSVEYSKEAQALIAQCLAELKTQHSHVEPSNLSGSSLTVALPYLADHFHQQYHVLVSLQLDITCEKIEYAIQTAIYRITYEAILAAINNGNGGVFAVHVNESNNKIWLKITDNEQSFAQFNSKINFDMAMYYIRQVANKFNATFHTYDNQEHGSEIIISIPLMKMS
jgi:ligand-binding sensor domain-containing protein